MGQQDMERGCSSGRRVRFIYLVIALLGAMTFSAHAGTPSLQVSGDTPLRADGLPQSDVDAIVAEATAIDDQPRSTSLTPLPARWHTIDPARLSALLSMPAFAGIPRAPRGVLLNQAATWDLLSFRRPSDAAALWERVWPRGPNGDPKAAPNHSGIGYLPDPTWSPTAKAMATIFACFPTTVWSAPEDPMVWAVRNSAAWQWRNEYGWDGFRRCIPDGAFFPDERPDKAGLDAITALIKSKLSDELFADGCNRPGPDSCMLLFQALFSLDSRNPQLPAIVHLMEPAFDLDGTIELPAVKAAESGNDLSPAGLQALYGPETEALRRNIFLTLKLPVLLRNPSAWPPGELERTLVQATHFTVLLARIQKLETFRHQKFDRYFNNPWQWIDAEVAARVAPSQRELGATYARRDACALAELDVGWGTKPFWQGYVVENIRQGQAHCGLFDRLRLPEVYRAAKSTRPSRAHAPAMGALQPIAAALTQEGPLHELALDAVAAECGGEKRAASRDPWHLCAKVAARDAQRAAQQAGEERARLDALPPVDKLACEDGTIARAAEALHYAGGADFWSGWNTACRLDPSHPGQAIIALSYRKGEELSGQTLVDSQANYDLDVIVFNLRNDTVVAHRHQPEAILSEAISYEELSIDTGPYLLAPGKRAFGIRTRNSSHCYQCVYGYANLTLYLQTGSRIDPVMVIPVAETRGEPAEECPHSIAYTTTAVSVGAGKSHGFADLLLTTAVDVEANALDVDGNGEADAPTCTAHSVSTFTAHFDGHAYQVPVAHP